MGGRGYRKWPQQKAGACWPGVLSPSGLGNSVTPSAGPPECTTAGVPLCAQPVWPCVVQQAKGKGPKCGWVTRRQEESPRQLLCHGGPFRDTPVFPHWASGFMGLLGLPQRERLIMNCHGYRTQETQQL